MKVTNFPQEFVNFAAEAEEFDHPQRVIIILRATTNSKMLLCV